MLLCRLTPKLSGGAAVRLERTVRHKPKQPTRLLEPTQIALRRQDTQNLALTSRVHHTTRALAADATGATCGGKTDRKI